jgi:hypothetical protein
MELRQQLESSGSGSLAPSAPFAAPAPSILGGATAGSRRALCIGINAYPTAPLEGCIADATAWMSTLSALGFAQPILLTDAQATRAAIIGALAQLFQVSRAGDVVVMQYSGHGTQLRDVDGDDEDDRDEAICPYDFADGAFIIDDDFARVFAQIPDGVSVTCFFDCCHSGTNTRLAVGVPVLAGAARPRFLRATPEMQASHSRFRAGLPAAPFDARRHPDLMRQVVFAACMDREVAYEENQQGDFTRFALPILQRGESMSNDRFHQAVVRAFGTQPRQHPWLDCSDAARGAALFGFTGRTEGAGRGIGSLPTGSGDGNSTAALLDAIAAVLRGE